MRSHRNYQTVMDREQDADNVTREVLIAVRRTFITPFDRGNIRDLITSMDNSIDQMQKTAKSIMLFDVTEFTPQMRDMADAIVKCAELVQEGVPLLQSISAEAGHISDLTAQISALEGKADEMHDNGLRELYQANVGEQRAGILRRQRSLRPSGKGRRSLRRRRQRDARHRHRARLVRARTEQRWTPDARIAAAGGADRCRAGVRFPQRHERCRQFDRDRRFDARAASAIRRRHGRHSSISSPSWCSACTSPRPSAAASWRPISSMSASFSAR